MNHYRDYGEGTLKKTDEGYELSFEWGPLREETPIAVALSGDGKQITITEGGSGQTYILDRISSEEFKDFINKSI